MDADGPGDRKVDERLDPVGIGHPFAFRLEHVPADQNVEEEVAVQDDHVPKQDRVGGRVEEHIQEAHGFPEIDDDEQEAHGHRGHRQKFTQDGDASEDLDVVQIIGQDHHDSRGGHTDKEGKLGDVDSPGDVPAHTGDGEAFVQLHQIGGEAQPDEHHQSQEKAVIFLTSSEGSIKHNPPP